MYKGEAFARKYIQYPFVATTVKQKKEKSKHSLDSKNTQNIA